MTEACFSDQLRKAVEEAQRTAQRLGAAEVELGHLLDAVARTDDASAAILCRNLGIPWEGFVRLAAGLCGPAGPPTLGDLPLRQDLQDAVRLAWETAIQLRHAHVGTEHLLAAVAGLEDAASAAVRRHLGLQRDHALAALSIKPRAAKDAVSRLTYCRGVLRYVRKACQEVLKNHPDAALLRQVIKVVEAGLDE